MKNISAKNSITVQIYFYILTVCEAGRNCRKNVPVGAGFSLLPPLSKSSAKSFIYRDESTAKYSLTDLFHNELTAL